MKKYHFVYITRRIGTPYYYYGVHSTNNINDGYIGSGYHFLNAVRKYGKESFSREIIKFFESHDEALKFENEIITKEVLEDEYCYNIQHGGKGSKDEHTLSTKEKMSLSAKERKIPQETRNKLKESMKRKIELYGYYHSEETRKRISETLKSKDMGKYNKGRIQTESERNKRSISLKLAYKEGRHKKSDLSGDKNPMYGKHFTDSMKQNLSNAQKERFSNVLEREKTSISTKNGMIKSEKWNTYKAELKSGIRDGSMKGKSNPNFGKSMKLAMHIRHHIKKGIFNKECDYCVIR